MLAICLKMIHNEKRKMKRLLQRLLLVDSLFSLVDNKFCLRLVLYLLTSVLGLSVFQFSVNPMFQFQLQIQLQFQFQFQRSRSRSRIFQQSAFRHTVVSFVHG